MVRQKRASNAFDGIGAAMNPGRWNSPNSRIVYCASNLSLAVLEIIANLGDSDLPPNYLAFRIAVDSADILTLQPSKLPHKWNSDVPGILTRKVGDDWLSSMSSLALEIPSSVLPSETNVLLNPLHPKMIGLDLAQFEPLVVNHRLLK